ncbi:MAG: indolepyruvate oxidoreductase subunit beta [Desulfohalobiaceae bacterium]|nr:indolepyruvate oxidoreductase subunit beta [Desulfohalobiaceae bacterium]
MNRMRLFLAGVGGQGTLTATNLLSLTALDHDIDVCSGEIHGMAQRGGIVESTLLLGGYVSPRITSGEADVLLGFEPLETLRALHYLRPGGLIVGNLEPTYPVGVSTGQEIYPDLDFIQKRCRDCSTRSFFLPCKSLGAEAGTTRAANIVLLGALSARPESPFGLDDLKESVRRHLPEKIKAVNLKALELGRGALESAAP